MSETAEPAGEGPAPEPPAAPAPDPGPLRAQRALVAPATVDRAARSVQVVWSTGARAQCRPTREACEQRDDVEGHGDTERLKARRFTH